MSTWCWTRGFIFDSLYSLLQNATDLLQNAIASLLQNATEVCYKMRQFFITKYDTFITKCGSYYKRQQFYYKLRQLLQNATLVTNCDSTVTSVNILKISELYEGRYVPSE